MNSREAKLESLAKRMKARALKSKKPITLNSMNPRDRRIVHQFLHDDDQVTTKSFGDGHYKRIKIFPVLPKKNEELPTEEVETGTVMATEEVETTVEETTTDETNQD